MGGDPSFGKNEKAFYWYHACMNAQSEHVSVSAAGCFSPDLLSDFLSDCGSAHEQEEETVFKALCCQHADKSIRAVFHFQPSIAAISHSLQKNEEDGAEFELGLREELDVGGVVRGG